MKPQPALLAEEFLAMLAHERAASPHTLRAYQREIGNFAAYLVEQRGIVELQQTSTRGRAVIVHLSAAGVELERELKKAAKRRDKRLMSSFSANERGQTVGVIRRLIASVPAMNRED